MADDRPADSSNPNDLGARAKRALGLTWTLLVNAFKGLSTHHGTQLAAGMAYYALFAIFPAVLVVAAVAGMVLDDPAARADLVDFLLEELPVSTGEGAQEIETLVDGITENAGALGLIGVLGLMLSASALISSARTSLSFIFGDQITRGAIRGKLVDLLLIIGVGLLFGLSFAVTIVSGLNVDLGAGIGESIEAVLDWTGLILPILISAAVFAALYSVLPASRPPLREIWPGALFAALAYELLKRGFSIYLDNFANYGAVYGSLGAIIAFMFFAYLASVVFLVGAEMASLWPRAQRGELQGDPDPRSFKEKVQGAISGLFRTNSSE